MFAWVQAIDKKTPGILFHILNQPEWFIVKHMVRLISLTGDEMVLFIIPVFMASWWVATEAMHNGTEGALHHIPFEIESLVNIFGGMCICALIEQILKCTFKRPRPSARPYNNYQCCIWGEWWSFPSGHTLRSAYLAQWFFSGPIAQFLPDETGILKMLLFSWAACVGLARVAVARHYPSDVIVGFVIGFNLGIFIERKLFPWEGAVLKTICGVFIAAQVWFMLLGPLVDSAFRNTLHLKIQAIHYLCAGAFFAFYGGILILVSKELFFPGGIAYNDGYFSCNLNGTHWACSSLLFT